MRYASKKKMQVAASAVAAAAFGAWMGVPSAHADLVVSLKSSTVGTVTASGGPAGSYTDYVIQAYNNGLNATGSTFLALDGILTTPGTGTAGAIFIDLNADIDGDGMPDADVYGAADDTGNTPQPSFGGGANGFLGSFIGLAPSSLLSSHVSSNFSVPAPGGVTPDPFLTGETATNTLDPNYTNGTLHSLEVIGIDISTPIPAGTAATKAVPFANIVVPTNTPWTLSGTLGSAEGATMPFTISGGPAQPTGVPVRVSLSGSALSGTTAAGSVTLVGSNGSYKAVTQSIANLAAFNVAIDPFSSGDQGIIGLDITPGSVALSQIIADLNTALGSAGTAGAPHGSEAAVLTGDNVEIDFPNVGTGGPLVFSADLTGDSATVSSITVVPEPTGLGALVLAGVGLMSRRKARKA